ncbi:MAG: nucleoside recognition protein [Bacteroidales bacterium]|nr:nucleoside recognition protein [Bacteroidales bacterium]
MKETLAEQQNLTFINRILLCIKEALPQGVKTAIWLLKITIPVSFGVLLLDYFGGLEYIAQYTTPVFKFIGLPGVAAIVIITSVFTNIYSVVAVLTALALPVRDGTIIAVMCLISHGFIIETAVLKKTGSSPIRMILLRLISSFIVGWVLNKMMPGNASIGELININKNLIFHEVLVDWLYLISKTIVKILVLVNLLLILQKILEEFKLIKLLERPLKPIMKFFGLPEQTTFSLIVANTLGLAYGSAVMINQVKEGKMKKKQADLLNHHISLSHSQLEDPLLFLTLGYSIPWLILPRVVIGIIAVWIRKIEIRIKQN